MKTEKAYRPFEVLALTVPAAEAAVGKNWLPTLILTLAALLICTCVSTQEVPEWDWLKKLQCIAAALILADKSDVRRSRVRNPEKKTFDIHDRVNYSVEKSLLKINREHSLIKLKLSVDTHYGSVMDYFEIFLERMVLCRKAAEKLGLQFKLMINEQSLI